MYFKTFHDQEEGKLLSILYKPIIKISKGLTLSYPIKNKTITPNDPHAEAHPRGSQKEDISSVQVFNLTEWSSRHA